MPSSTSNSELPTTPHLPYQREVPAISLGVAWLIAIAVFAVGFFAWEAYWRSFGARPAYRNSDAAWAEQRRRVNHGDGNATVLIGSSRVLFDIQLHVWEQVTGQRPIQLAQEGTSPIFALEDLADDPAFRGRLLVGVTPPLFFTGRGRRRAAVENWRKETLAQQAGHWLSVHFVEPLFAYYDEDFALMTILARQNWPERSGVPNERDVRRLSEADRDRNTHMWPKVASDEAYRTIARDIWRQTLFERFKTIPPGAIDGMIAENLDRVTRAVRKLQAKNVPVVFVRLPAAGPFLEFENNTFPRNKTWDVLLERTGAPGIHFEDYPELQTYTLPEWSHMPLQDAERFTAALCPIVAQQPGWTAP